MMEFELCPLSCGRMDEPKEFSVRYSYKSTGRTFTDKHSKAIAAKEVQSLMMDTNVKSIIVKRL